MKKFTMVLMGAFVIAIASAFTTAKPAAFAVAYGYTGTRWVQVNTQDQGITFNCNDGTNYCLYQDPSFANPFPGQSQNKQFVTIP